ncbi:adenylate/guanylate cyclase domain-containing protein [Nocardioides cynanchi]|uniref:adenylate/guanylate cyclase domain-containing protein n=1 Tax=Nocardioides cynanchi TaxID=2558918 RepID=UPI0017826F6B|nr:adenylate/guanylate cyclase domain-containing protein [Nocardioides cynanchi]
MSGLPSGTVTFLFSDIEGSTSLLKALGDGYGDVLDTHRRLMRTSFHDLGGVEIDTQGDAFFFAFPRARDAVAAAVEAQRLHAVEEWPEERPVRVRMGLHTGEPAMGSEGYLGIDVVRAARLCTVGRGGQVLLSETTRALVGGTLPDGVSVHALGERQLKDIDEPERIFELAIEGAASPEAAPAVAEAPPAPAEAPAAAPPPWPPTDEQPSRTADFGARLVEQIQDHVRQVIENPLQRTRSQADSLAERVAEKPATITEKLDHKPRNQRVTGWL